MDISNKILVCFSEDDNQPFQNGLKGWVSNFHKFLSTLLSQILREEAELKLASESDFDQLTLADYGVIILISTQGLLRHKALVKAINEHAESLKKSDNLTAEGVPRIFKVHKSPFDEDKELSALEDIISYDFYIVDPISGEPQEFQRFFGSDAERSYWMKLVDMAYDINQIIAKSTLVTKKKTEFEEVPREKTVYLASSGMDMVIQRDIIKRELIRHGYKVLPQHTLPKETKALDAMVKEDLQKCRLSIHMVGEDYGYKPRGSEISVVDIQNRIASNHTHDMVEYNENAKEKQLFSRLIWLSPDLKNVTERQKIFIEDLKSDAASLEEAEVLQITLPEFKSIIREELVTGGRFNLQREVKGYTPAEEGKEKIIYLIHDKPDKKDTKPLQDYLQKSGFRVVEPTFDGDLADIRYIHQENLRRCDASIIYFGKAKEAWIKTKLQDLLKAPGFGREKKLQAKAIYCEGKKISDLNHYEKHNALVLGNNGGFKPEYLKPFLTKLEK